MSFRKTILENFTRGDMEIFLSHFFGKNISDFASLSMEELKRIFEESYLPECSKSIPEAYQD